MMGDSIRFRRQVLHLRELGPRAIAELLVEIAQRADCAPVILELLDEYEDRLTPDMVHLVGGDQFPRRIPLLVR
jgi:hypothetical protein